MHLLFLPQVTLNKYIGSHQNDGLYIDLPFQNREHRKFKGKQISAVFEKKKFIKKAPSKFHNMYLFAEANLELLP